MKTHVSILALLLAAAGLVAACTGEEQPVRAKVVALANAPAPSANATVHAVRCGCEIEAVGSCSEHIEVDGAWVPLELPGDFGSMPFCGKSGLKAKVDGEVVDGVFVAKTFAYVE